MQRRFYPRCPIACLSSTWCPANSKPAARAATERSTGRARGREAFDRLTELANAGAVEIVGLTDEAAPYFEDLAVGAAAATLDDGEAATIAYALAHAGTALIDERKATRICAHRFPQLQVACTVDVLVHPEVQRRLGADLLGDVVFRALRDGYMGVLPRHVDWIVGLIGEARAALCPSLPRRFRTSSATAKLPAGN
jgi:hypothetical protein